MRQLFLSVAIPKLVYAINVWYTLPTKPAEVKKCIGSVTALKGMQKAQRIATLAITGALRTTPTDLLDSHAGINTARTNPTESNTQSSGNHRTHPLHRYVVQAARTTPSKHLSAIDFLINNLDLIPNRVETICPGTTKPSLHPKI